MTDIELHHLGNGGDRHDIVEGEAVAGMRLDPVLPGKRRGVGDPAQLGGALLPLQMGVAAGVELDDGHLQADRRFDLPSIGPKTVEAAAGAGLAGVAVIAGETVVADPAALADAADRAGLFVIGVGGPAA